MNAGITMLYPNEEQLKAFFVREIEKGLNMAGLLSRDNPSVVLTYYLHRFFTVLSASGIKPMFLEHKGRVEFPNLSLVHLKVLETLLIGYGDRKTITPLSETVSDAFRVLKILSIIIVPPPNLVL
jgi:hypothetical protein